MELSVIVPMFNEAGRLGVCLRPVLAYLASEFPGTEILLVDDGSSDGTFEEVRKLSMEVTNLAARVLRLSRNRGKGAAVREGMRAACGRVRVFLDADNATPVEELRRLVRLVQTPRTIVIGTRASEAARPERRQPWLRQMMGKTFNLLVRWYLRLPYRDTQCGFKLFGSEAADVCFGRQKLERFAFDAELLWIARREGLSVVEVPVRWRHVEESRVRPLLDSLIMLKDLLRIRFLHP